MLWAIHWMMLRGMRGAAKLNALVTTVKVAVLLIYTAVVAYAFKRQIFVADFWGHAPLGSVYEQVKSTLLITVWVFIGIEGASVLSARARCRADIGHATVLGFISVLLLLMAVSLLSFGVLTQTQLAALRHPSMAGVLEHVVGHWGAVFINLGLLGCVGGSLFAWTLLAAETLFTPARDGIMPRFLTQENPQGMPTNALWLTSGFTQLLLLLTLATSATYLTLISLATSMILVPYLFSAIYACRIAVRGEGYTAHEGTRWRDMLIGAVATLYCVWLLYGAGPKYLLLSALLYAPSAILYGWAKRERNLRLSTFEIVLLVGQFSLAALAVWLLATGTLHL
jgi:arginine:ornithine antiporter/lysine permease